MRWPRCGFWYVTSPDDVLSGRWHRCTRRWGHWVFSRRHAGPRSDRHPRWARGLPLDGRRPS